MGYVIAIDGPAGAGKSTIARILASKLGFVYLDTGALYRSITYQALQAGTDLEDEDALAEIARTSDIDLRQEPDGLRVLLNGRDVTSEIRTPEVTNHTFYIARSAKVRTALLPLQRRFAEKADIIAEGRDVTTVVFPEADLKVYLDASLEERAQRRQQDLEKAGVRQAVADVAKEVAKRDTHDRTRSVAPLRQAPDAVYLDSSKLTVAEEVELLAELFRTAVSGKPAS